METYLRKRKRGGRNSNPSSSSSSSSDWSNIGADILQEITKRCDSRTEILRLRAICKGWRSSIPLPPRNVFKHVRLPRILPFPTAENSKGKDRLLLVENIIYSFEPLVKIHNKMAATPNWFVKIEDSKFGKVRIKNPLTILSTDNLRKNTSLGKVINLLDYRVRVVAKEYCINVVGRSRPREYCYFKKVVVGQKKEGEFVVMVRDLSGSLAVWKMGEDKWVEIDNGVHYKDIAYHKGRFYAVDSTSRIIAVNSSSWDITLVAPPPPGLILDPLLVTFLVESLGDLYLISKSSCSTQVSDILFPNVFKLDEELGKWVDLAVWGLRDQVMFLGLGGNSYSVPAGKFDGCKDNCIYFWHRSRYIGADDYPGSDVLLYDFQKHQAQSLKSVEGYSQLFWPPPTWL